MPVIADEIYDDMTFEGNKFYSFASINNDIPVLAVGGIAKKYMVPGWRLGWILIHDYHNYFKDV